MSSCSKAPDNTVHRLALLPANVLIDDPSSKWLRLALPFVFQTDLATARSFLPTFASNESAAYQVNADQVLRITVENRKGQVWMQGTITDLVTQKNREVIDVENKTFIAAADSLARRLDDHSLGFSTTSDAALEAYSRSLDTSDVQARISSVSAAIAADPHFGLAHVARLEIAGASGNEAVSTYIAEGTKDRAGFKLVDRARFDALVSRITRAPIADQEKTTADVLRYVPNDADSYAVLGSLQFLAGDSAGGTRSFQKATELLPSNANFRRQWAMGLIESKKFKDAENVLTPLAKANPSVLPDLAIAILLNGDAARANRTFEQFLTMRPPNDPLATLLRGTWLALGGQLNGAITLLQAANITDPNLRPAFLSQITIWQLATGNRAGAKKTATEAASANRAFPAALLAVLLAAGDQDPGTWRKLVESSRIGANESFKQALLGYGYFLGGHYADAADVWQRILTASGGTDLRSRAMLAGSLDRTGRTDDAKKVLVQPFVPEFTDLYSAISFGEMRRLLGLQLH